MRIPRLGLLTLLAALVLTSSAAGLRLRLGQGRARPPGPSSYDRVFVDKHGPKKAETVLVLIPGTSGGPAASTRSPRISSTRVDGLQVWNFDRRTQVFEDTSVFEGGDAQAAADYYLGFQYERVTADRGPVRLRMGLRDRAERPARGDRARLPGRSQRDPRRPLARRVLGGRLRRLGLQARRRGYRDLDGLILIDGGLAAFGPAGLLAGGRAGAARRDPGRRHLQRPARGRDPRDRPDLPRGRRHLRGRAARRALRPAEQPADRGRRPLAALPGHQRGLPRLPVRHTYSPLAPSLQIRAGDFGPGRPAALGRAARTRRSRTSPRPSRASPATRPSGTTRTA